MKKYFYGVLVAALVVSCSPENKEATSTQAKSDTTATAATTATTTTTVTTESAGTTATALSTTTIAATPAEAAKDTTATATPAPASKPYAHPKSAEKKAKGEKTMSDYQDKVVDMKTSKGTITIRFFPNVAPNHVKNFIDLAEKGFYNGTKFHRVIPRFMIQGGDPNTISGNPYTWGTGGAPMNLKAEFNNIHHARGIVSMARSSDPDSASSQFFICVADAPSLDRQYSVFGQVTKGMDVADEIVNAPRDRNDRPDQPVSIVSITVRPASAEEKALPPPATLK